MKLLFLIPVSHLSFILTPRLRNDKYHNKSVNFPRSTRRRQKQQPFLPMNNLVGLSPSYGGCINRRRTTQTHTTQPFCHNPRGSDKVQTSWKKKKIMSPKQSSSTYTRKIERKKQKRKRRPSSPCDYSLKLDIIRSQTWFTPCSSLIVLKSSVTRRRRRTPASKCTYMCRRKRTYTHTLRLDRE